MRERMSILLILNITVVALTAGVSPANAASKPEYAVGRAYLFEKFDGPYITVQSQAVCEPIDLLTGGPAQSAVNTSTDSTITLYEDIGIFGCGAQVAVLGPGDRDNGYIIGTGERSQLGRSGARYYSST